MYPADSFVQEAPPGSRLLASREATLTALSAVLSSTVDAGDSDGGGSPGNATTYFHAKRVPEIGVGAYVARLGHYAYCSNAALIAALVLLHRARIADSRLQLSALSMHRLLLTAVVVSAKFHDDVSYKLDYYGKVGGVTPKQLRKMEATLLSVLAWRLQLKPADFARIERNLSVAAYALHKSDTAARTTVSKTCLVSAVAWGNRPVNRVPNDLLAAVVELDALPLCLMPPQIYHLPNHFGTRSSSADRNLQISQPHARSRTHLPLPKRKTD